MKKFIFLLLLSGLFVVACNTEEALVTPEVDTAQFLSPELGLSFEYERVSSNGNNVEVNVENMTADGLGKVTFADGAVEPSHSAEVMKQTGATPEESVKALVSGKDAATCEVVEYEGPTLGLGQRAFGIAPDAELGLEADCGSYKDGMFVFFDTSKTRMVYILTGQDTFMPKETWRKTMRLEDLEV